MPMTRTRTPRIGELVRACEAGRRAHEAGRYRPPAWVLDSPTLEGAYREGYRIARRGKGATDGTAR